MTNTETTPTQVTDVTPELLKQWLERDEATLVDVREDYEHASEHIEGANLHPLSKFDAEAVRAKYPQKRVVFQCRSGKRSHDAASRFAKPDEKVFHLAGGIEGWKASGMPVKKAAGASAIPVMRQVQIVAGSLVVLGVVLGIIVSPWFLMLSGFVGAGLVFAGISGWCGMAVLLGVMPWNKVNEKASSASCSA